MNITKVTFLLICISYLSSCKTTNKEKLKKIISSNEVIFQENAYGGIAGYSERKFHFKRSESETLLIIDTGTDYQTFIPMDNKKELFISFIKEAYKTNNPGKKLSNSCMTGVDFEYIFKCSCTTLKLRPDLKASSILHQLIHTEENKSHNNKSQISQTK